jgi:GAF domain-containing protein
MELVQAIAERASQALERARLFEESERRAIQNRLVAEVTARVRESLDMETVLKTTADEMYQALGLDEVVIRLVPGGDGRADKGHEPPAAST